MEMSGHFHVLSGTSGSQKNKSLTRIWAEQTMLELAMPGSRIRLSECWFRHINSKFQQNLHEAIHL